MGSLDGQSLATANKWEELKQTGDEAVRSWIGTNISGKSCLVVLMGSETAGRKWVKYEIKKAWKDGRGVLGIHVNKLKHIDSNTSARGASPFASINANGISLAGIPSLKIPSGETSQATYSTISRFRTH